MTQRSRKALIIGAGIAGPITAILLKRAGIDAQVFEAWPRSTGVGGGLQIAPNGMHVLAEAGGYPYPPAQTPWLRKRSTFTPSRARNSARSTAT